jgi:hypothetical protein
MAEDQKEAIKKIVAKLKLASTEAKKIAQDANSADSAVDEIEKEAK